jgi:hypothetical protein
MGRDAEPKQIEYPAVDSDAGSRRTVISVVHSAAAASNMIAAGHGEPRHDLS